VGGIWRTSAAVNCLRCTNGISWPQKARGCPGPGAQGLVSRAWCARPGLPNLPHDRHAHGGALAAWVPGAIAGKILEGDLSGSVTVTCMPVL